jgi:hypothetical protein
LAEPTGGATWLPVVVSSGRHLLPGVTATMLTTRIATIGDAAGIARIYNQGIEERIATFETEPRSVEQLETQLREKGDRYPTVVVEKLLGEASPD